MKPLLLAIVFILTIFSLQAQIAGGGITYKHIGQDSFLVELTLYRNCQASQLDTAVALVAKASCNSPDTQMAYLDTAYSLKTTCDSVCSPCSNSTCSSYKGFYKHIYSTIFHLDDTCSNWEIYTAPMTMKRDSAIQTGAAGEDFFLVAEINTNQPNSSPQFTTDGLKIPCLGQCYLNSDFVCFDEEGDSLVYAVVCPLQSQSNPVTYNSFSCISPIGNVHWSCAGFQFSPTNGTAVYRPGVWSLMAVQVDEYRNGSKIGSIRKEVELPSVSCTAIPAYPYFTGFNGGSKYSRSLYTCPGDTISFYFYAQSNSTIPPILKLGTKLKNARLDTLTVGTGRVKGTFTWIVPQNFGSYMPIHIIGDINSCPYTAQYVVSYQLQLLDSLDNISSTITQTACGDVRFYPPEIFANYSYSWTINDTLIRNSYSPYSRFLLNGKYPYILKGTNGICNYSEDDSFEVNSSDLILTSNDTIVCEGEQVQIAPIVSGGTPPLKFKWLKTYDTTRSYSFIAKRDTAFEVQVTDSFGCTKKTWVYIDVNPLPQVQVLNDTALCIDAGPFQVTGLPVNGTWSGHGLSGDTLYPDSAGAGLHELYYSITDTNLCSNTDTLKVRVNPLPQLVLPMDTALCSDAGVRQLTATPAVGVWSGNGMSGSTFNPIQAGIGTHYLTYSYTDGNSCNSRDSFSITVNGLPIVDAGMDLKLCFGNAIPLSGVPAGGTWSGPGVSGTSFNPADAGIGQFQLRYVFSDSNNCKSSDTRTIKVFPVPNVDAGPERWICQSDTAVQLVGAPTGGTWSGTGVTNNILSPAGLSGDHWLMYSYSDTNTCGRMDSALVRLGNDYPTSDIIAPALCPYAILDLRTLNSNAAFTGAGVLGHNFFASQVGASNHKVVAKRNYNQQHCKRIDTFNIRVMEGPKAGFTAAPLSGNLPLLVNFTDTSKGDIATWHWQFTGNAMDSSNLQNPQYAYNQEGLYFVKLMVVDTAGCTDEIAKPSYIRVLPVGLAEMQTIELKLYPNPASEYFIIEIQEPEKHEYQVQVMNSAGKVVQEFSINSNFKKEVTRKELADGKYFVTFMRDGKRILVKQILLE